MDCFKGDLQEDPIFYGIIYGFRCRFSFKPSIFTIQKPEMRGIAGPGDFIGFLAMLNHFPYEQTVLVPQEAEDEAWRSMGPWDLKRN